MYSIMRHHAVHFAIKGPSRKDTSKAFKYIAHNVVQPVYKDIVTVAETPLKLGEGLLKEGDKLLSSPAIFIGAGLLALFLLSKV